jgi:uncharacterized protein
LSSTATIESTAPIEPAVIGYPNLKGVAIERVAYKARNMDPAVAKLTEFFGKHL